ncbi:MAG: ATP-binding protein [Bacteroidota bacterium]|nr:ATP-binding protein [Bacteroidota bacterium]
MLAIQRRLEKLILERLKPNKVVLIFGARRVGKTFLLKKIDKEFKGKTIFLNAEDHETKLLLEKQSISSYKQILKDSELLILDEAQNIDEIGKILKLMVDEIQGIKIIATGSSSFDLQNISGEPLTGRSFRLQLFPISQDELSLHENLIETKRFLEQRLIYGSYPEILEFENNNDKKEYLFNIVNSYLLKDLLIFDGIRNSNKMLDLLKLIAYQMGNDVSYDELSKHLGLSKNTVEKYLDLLTKVFIIYRLDSYSKNLRKEIRKSKRFFFYDNGIRNAIISDFKPIVLRKDIGSIWENYLITERLKFNNYSIKFLNSYFWRTYDQQEIDLVEEIDGKLFGYEIKWSNKIVKPPKAWQGTYTDANFETINSANYLDWITTK